MYKRISVCLLTALFLSILCLPAFAQHDAGVQKKDSTECLSPRDLVKCTGSIGSFKITLFVNPNTSEGETAGNYFYNDRPNTHFRLVMVKNEGHLGGYNRLVM